MRPSSLWAVLGFVASSHALCPHARGADTPDVKAAESLPQQQLTSRGAPVEGKEGVFLMNRIGPKASMLYIANADGSNARSLLGNESVFEYHGHFSPDGQW